MELTASLCRWCENEIDQDWCWCGDTIEGHTWQDGHSPVPMGCTCYFVKEDEEDSK